MATPAPRISKEVALRPIDHKPILPSPSHINNNNSNSSSHGGRLSLDSVHGVTKLDLLPAQNVDVVDGISNAVHLGVPHHTIANKSSPHPIGHIGNNMKMHMNASCTMLPAERDFGTDARLMQSTSPPASFKAIPHRPVSGPEKLTIRSTLVKSQPPMLSAKLSNHHKIINTTAVHGSPALIKPTAISTGTAMAVDVTQQHHQPQPQNFAPPSVQQPQPQPPPQPLPQHHMQQSHPIAHPRQTFINARSHNHGNESRDFGTNGSRAREYHSSSDENRSSGHASMSDTGHRSNSPGIRDANENDFEQLREDRFVAAGVNNRNNRNRASIGHPRSRHRASPTKGLWKGGGLEDIKMAIQQLTMRSQTSTSTYSSVSAGSESSEPTRRLARYSSLETINTNVTTADEFVWVDSHNRLVEIQNPPWSQQCIFRVIRGGRCREHTERIMPETVPRLGYLLQRVLVRIAREIQRLCSDVGLCSKHEISGAFKIILCPALSDSCIKACLRAAAMFGVPGDSAFRQSKSNRAGLQLSIGRFHRWMCEARLGRFVHEYAAVYLAAGMENLIEEILLHGIPADATIAVTPQVLDNAIGNSGDFWGLLQPYAHLNAGRIATGALTMPNWPNTINNNTNGNNLNPNNSNNNVSKCVPAATMTTAATATNEPSLLITCVGSITELRGMVLRASSRFNQCTLSSAALTTLFYFMRCSQLEHNEGKPTHPDTSIFSI